MERSYLMRRVLGRRFLRRLLWQQGRVAMEMGGGCYGDGDGCYGDGRWLLWGWKMVAMEMGDGCYGDLVMSGPLYPSAPSALFCAFARPASPTSSAYPVGCLSPT